MCLPLRRRPWPAVARNLPGTVLLLVIAGRGCVIVARPYKIKNCRTTSTEQCACIATDSDTPPARKRMHPPSSLA